MIVLSRKQNESIVIAGNIRVTVVEIRGDKVRLAVEAPKETSVHRQEVYEAIHGSHRADPPVTISTHSVPSSPPPPVSAATPPTVFLPPHVAAWLDRLSQTLRLRASITVDRNALALALLETALRQLSADVGAASSPEQVQALLRRLGEN